MGSRSVGAIRTVRARFAVLIVLGLLGFAVALAIPTTGARELTGRAGQPASNAGCTVSPRTFADVAHLSRIGRSSAGTTVVEPGGASAPSATLDDVRSTLSEFVACTGAGEPLRVWALYSDAYLARLLSRERGYDRIRYDLDAEPRPMPVTDWPSVIALEGIRHDPTGRIVTDATILYPNLDRSKRLRFWFIWDDGRLRIDEVDGEITFAVP